MKHLSLISFALTSMVAVLTPPSLHAQQTSHPTKPLGSWLIENNAPAAKWDLGYPVGNGSMGAINLGAYPKEVISINHDTIWTKKPYVSPKPNSRSKKLHAAFRFCLEDNFPKAEKAYSKMLRTRNGISSYQYLGAVSIDYLGQNTPTPKVHRSLNLLTGESITRYTFPQGTTTQKIIASYPDQVIVIRLNTTLPTGLNCRIAYNRSEGVTSHNASKNTITFTGQAGKKRGKSLKELGTKFTSHLYVVPQRGLTVVSKNGELQLSGGHSATILISAATDHNRNSPRSPRVDGWQKDADTTLAAAQKKSWDSLRNRAVEDHRHLMLQNTIDLGTTPPEIASRPLPERFKRVKNGGSDPDLMELFYQLGRHMLIGSSRPGSLPPNLQGLWEGGTRAAWNGDFHLNINVQMNMWLANLTGISECNEPFLQLVSTLHQNGQEIAQSLGCRGYCAGLASDAWGYADFFASNLDWSAFTLGGHWAQEHLMEDFRFSGDKKFLKNQAWPILKDGSAFMLDWLQTDPKTGQRIANVDGSPENCFLVKSDQGKKFRSRININNTFGNSVAWETFTDTLECAKVLGIHDPILDEIKKALPLIPKPGISSSGMLMEWRKEYEEPWPGHRHKSHLYGFYPGHEFSVSKTPKLAKAALKSLDSRMKRGHKDAAGGGQTGWNLAWSSCLYARLNHGDQALDMLNRQLQHQVNPNLFNRCNHPFQIDGNLGSVAAIAEMLLQSFETDAQGNPIIRLLPALPTAWQNGEVRGLRARGGFIVDIQWKDGKLSKAKITSTRGTRATVVVNGKILPIRLKKGQSKTISK